MNDPKLTHCILGSIGSLLLGGFSFVVIHASLFISVIVGVFAIRASLWTARAGKAVYKNAMEKRRQENQ